LEEVVKWGGKVGMSQSQCRFERGNRERPSRCTLFGADIGKRFESKEFALEERCGMSGLARDSFES
jgi:hypothetical protein